MITAKLQIFQNLGVYVWYSQAVERILKFACTFILQDSEPLTFELISRLDQKKRKATLGRLFEEIGRKASFHPSIEATFERYLETRNLLVHRFDEIPGGTLETTTDIRSATHFISKGIDDLEVVLDFFTGLAHCWVKELDFADEFIKFVGEVPLSERAATLSNLMPLLIREPDSKDV